MELAKNQEHTVTIEGYGEGGMGVARIDGREIGRASCRERV